MGLQLVRIMNDEKKQEGTNKPMKLPRFSYQVPEDLTSDFLQEMKDDVRETASDCITAILRKHFRAKNEAKMLRAFTESPEERRAIPQYGPKQTPSDAGKAESPSVGEE